MESYDYLGYGTVVRRGHSQPGVDLTFVKQGAEGNGEAGDQYAGIDRFGRVVDQRWIDTGISTHTGGSSRTSSSGVACRTARRSAR